MRCSRILACLLTVLLTVELSAKQSAAVSVQVNAPTVEYQTYPVGQPPKRAKGISGGEAGLCETEISCVVGIAGETRRFSFGEATAAITSITFTIGEKIVIWVQEGYTPAIMDHEETHREISEHYYAMARKVALRLAEEAAVRKLPLGKQPKKQAMEKAFAQVQKELMDGLLGEINSRCEYAQERFDAITDHSRANVDTADAMAQALQEEAEHWAQTAGKP